MPQAILDLVEARQKARREKDFAGADALRDSLAQQGWVVEDTPDGPRVKARRGKATAVPHHVFADLF